MTKTLFTGLHSDSLSWDADRQTEALTALKSLRIRPSGLRVGYCHVSYEGYTKLRIAGLMTHQMSGEMAA
jgi:hypothetical protein